MREKENELYSLIMAQLLISYSQRPNLQVGANPGQPPGQPNSEPYKAILNEIVLEEIKTNFAGISTVIPVLSLGNSQCGRASTLEAFLNQGYEGSFSSEGMDPGVYVWTRPVPLNSMSLLLVKMWGVDFLIEEDEELDLINKKVMIALMSISSVCLICVDKSWMFQSLTAIYELYTPMKERLRLEVSKFLVFVEKEATLANSAINRQRGAFINKGFKNPPEILYRGNDGISATCKAKLLGIVGNLQNHEPFLTSHKRVMEVLEIPHTINALAITLKEILNVAKQDLNFDNFIEKIPIFTNQSYQLEMQHNVRMIRMSDSVLKGTVLEFFDDIPLASSHKIKYSLLETLQQQYDNKKPNIVMAIIGNQGMGKSTLLNHIVKNRLGCSKLPELFKTGNTGNHTTKASQVLSSPLIIGENQLLLVDLEGFGGTETSDRRLKILQDNLISAILTIASVPCILVRNELSSMEFVEQIIKKLNDLKNYFNYKIERVHLLVQDKNISADRNNDFEQLVQKINREQFEGQEVLKMRNKPNLQCESKTEIEKFLKELMADSNFPKRKQSGSTVLLEDLIVEMRCIAEHSSTNMSEISLNKEEIQEFNNCLSWKSPRLRRIFDEVKANTTDDSLELIFSEKCRQFMRECNNEFDSLPAKWNTRARVKLEIVAASCCAELVGIEYCYRYIKLFTANDFFQNLEEQIDFLYKQSKWIGSFNDNVAELKDKIIKVRKRYPTYVQTLDQILLKFEQKHNSLKNWFYANYGFQVVTFAISGGLGLATAGIKVAAGIASGKYSTTLALNKPAIELFTINEPLMWFMKTSTTLNSDAIRILEERNSPPVMVLLVIAAEELEVSSLLNEFIHCVVPFTPSSIVAFNNGKLMQILHFTCMNQRACIINLRMKNDKTNEKYKIVEKIAISLIPKVSLTCLFFNSPMTYANDIITNAFSATYHPRFNPRVAVIYPERSENMDFLATFYNLKRQGVQPTRIPVQSFTDESFKHKFVDVKNELNISTPLASQALLEALRDAERAANS